MKKIYGLILGFVLTIGLFTIAGTTGVEAAQSLTLNGKTKVTVKADQTVVYNFKLKKAGMVNLLTTTTYDDRKDITIKLFDSNDREILNDSGKWDQNDLHSDLHDMSMPIRLQAGNYKVSFTYEGDATWKYNVVTRYMPDTKLPANKSLKVKLYGRETVLYKVTVPENGYYLITSTAKSPYDIDFFILDKNGEAFDDDDASPDWVKNDAKEMYNMKWITKPMKKGQYYFKIVNKTSSIQEAPVKLSYKIPATKLTLNETKVTLKKGETFKIKAKIKPAATTDKLSYSSADKRIATVSKKGVVTAKKTGRVKITVKTSSGKKKSILVTVK